MYTSHKNLLFGSSEIPTIKFTKAGGQSTSSLLSSHHTDSSGKHLYNIKAQAVELLRSL